MAVWYSDWYATQSTAGGSAITVPAIKVPWRVNNRHYKRCQIVLPLSPTAFTSADVARLMTFKSVDVIHTLYITAAGATAAAADVGLYLSGANHDGAVVDADLFASALALTTLARTDEWLESAVNTSTDRGQPLWQLAEAVYTTGDPNLELDLCLTCTTTLTTALGTVTVEALGSFS